jgi:hypothetical protein
MSRRAETSIPILLWISAAAVVHYGSFHGADAVADVGIGKMEMRSFAASIRNGLRPSTSPFEVTFEVDSKDEAKPEDKPDEPKIDPSVDPKKAEKAEKKPEKPPEKKPEKKPEPEKKLVLPQMTAAPPPPPPPPPADKRTAVDQHVEDKKQKDNPEAQFISDNANHVKEETVAKITAHDRNDKDPTLSKSHSSADKEAGDADKTKVADSDDHAGNPKQTPGEKSTAKNDPTPGRQGQPSATAAENEPKPANLPPSDKAGQAGKPGPKGAAQPVVPPPPTPQPAPDPVTPPKASPDTQNGPKGNYIINPFSGGSDSAKPEGSSMPKVPPAPTTQQVFSMPKLGGGPGPKGVNFNISTGGALAAIGTTNLAKEREAEGEQRRSAHRGAYKPASLDRWRAAITNYVASVKTGNTTALNSAQSAFGTYLHHIHNLIHPIFADGFLDSLDNTFPANHPINAQKLVTWLEIVVDGETGKIVKMGVVKASGVTAFDVAALDAVDRAGKGSFGKPPTAILSPDGNVYFHWEFHRDRPIACGTQNARPYIVNGGGTKAAPAGSAPVGPRAPEPPKEK